MFRKIMKTVAAILTVVSIFAMTVLAEEVLSGDTDGKKVIGSPVYITEPEPIIQVELPGDLAFGINPLNLDADGDGTEDPQIISREYIIKNHSKVPVLIEAITTLSGENQVEIVTEPSIDNDSNVLRSSSADKKAIFLVQLLPVAPATISEDGTPSLHVTDLETIPTTPSLTNLKGYVVGTDPETTPAVVNFKLAAKTGETLSPACVSGFKFAGAVDPTKEFHKEDGIKVTTVFTLNVLDEDQAGQYSALDQSLDATVVKIK